MEVKEYIDKLKRSYINNFEIKTDISLLKNKIDMFAKYHEVNVRTMITPKDIIDSFETNEMCFVKKFDILDFTSFNQFIKMLKSAEKQLVQPHKDHKSSYITGIMICNKKISQEIKKEIKKFKFSRAYKFYLHGWCDIRLILIDLYKDQVITNKAGKIVEKVYQTHLNKN